MVLIGFVGLKRSGKDTATDYLVEKFKFQPFAFADALKKVCSEIYRLPAVLFYKDELKDEIIPEWNMTPRDMLLKIGTKLRELDPNIWLNGVAMDIEKSVNRNIVISDVRFANEAQFVKDNGGILIRIIRDSAIRLAEQELAKSHVSESLQCFIRTDYEIYNNGSIEYFKQEIEDVVNTLMIVK